MWQVPGTFSIFCYRHARSGGQKKIDGGEQNRDEEKQEKIRKNKKKSSESVSGLQPVGQFLGGLIEARGRVEATHQMNSSCSRTPYFVHACL